MARPPSSVAFLRPLLHKLRNMARSFLGLDATGAYALPGHFSVELPIGETFQRVMDRICLLESQVNWRLYGLPAAVGNVKLEQAGILANGLELENLVSHLAQINIRQNEESIFAEWFRTTSSKTETKRILVVCSYSLLKSEAVQESLKLNRANVWLIADVEDLYLPSHERLIPQGLRVLRAPLLSVLAGMANEELAGIWFSDAHVRMHPLKWILALQQAERALAPQGNAKGIFISEVEAARDARCLKQIPAAQWGILSTIQSISLADDSYEIQK